MSFFRISLLLICFLIGEIITAQTAAEFQTPLSNVVQNLELTNATPHKFNPFTANTFAVNTFETVVNNANYFVIDTMQIQEIMLAHYPFIEVVIPMHDTTITVQLFPSEINTTNLKVTNSNGNTELYFGGAHYRGIIKNNNASLVALSFYKDEILGIISSPEIGNIVIAKLKSS